MFTMINRNKLTSFFLILSFMIMIPSMQNVQATIDELNQSSSGQTGGVIWSYSTDKERTRTSSLSISDSTDIQKSDSTSKTISTNINLIIGNETVDSFYNRFVQFTAKDGSNSPYKQEKGWGLKGAVGNQTGNVDNILVASVDTFYRYHWAEEYIFTFNKSKLLGQAILGLAGGPLKLYTGNIYVGNLLTSSWFTTNVTVEIIQYVTIPIIDGLQQKYGELQVPEVNITFLFDQNQTPGDLSDDQVIMVETLVPQYQLIKLLTQSYPVTVSQATVTSASLQGSYNFSTQYSETNVGNEVLVSDGKNFVFGWYGLESTTINYEQAGGFTLSGDLVWNVTRDIKFASNGSVVREDIRMPWWKSSYMMFSGTWSSKFADNGTVVGIGALQTVVEAIRTRASTTSSDQLLIWANIIPSTMFGYTDLDNSGDASVRLNGSTLQILDKVMAVGLTEGVHLDGLFDFNNYVSAKAYWQLGSDILTDKNELATNQGTIVQNQTWGVDPRSTSYSNSDVTFNWQTPVIQNGKATFKWDTEYKQFPTTWAVTDGTTEILNHVELINIGYDYTLTVDPAQGKADLSNTYSNSGIQNATVKAMVQDLSFATYKRDLFLGMQKASDSADPTESTAEQTLSTSFGSTDILDQTFGGSKQQYTLAGGSSYDSQTTVVNVITGTGNSGEPESVNVSTYSPFASSKFARNVGMSLLKWSADDRTKNSGINWEFRENIVITAYPTWKGLAITHDPSYSSVYTPSQPTSTASGTHTTSSSSITTGAPWNLEASLLAILLLVSIIRLRKKIKK